MPDDAVRGRVNKEGHRRQHSVLLPHSYQTKQPVSHHYLTPQKSKSGDAVNRISLVEALMVFKCNGIEMLDYEEDGQDLSNLFDKSLSLIEKRFAEKLSQNVSFGDE